MPLKSLLSSISSCLSHSVSDSTRWVLSLIHTLTALMFCPSTMWYKTMGQVHPKLKSPAPNGFLSFKWFLLGIWHYNRSFICIIKWVKLVLAWVQSTERLYENITFWNNWMNSELITKCFITFQGMVCYGSLDSFNSILISFTFQGTWGVRYRCISTPSRQYLKNKGVILKPVTTFLLNHIWNN